MILTVMHTNALMSNSEALPLWHDLVGNDQKKHVYVTFSFKNVATSPI
jgi:hypothetical protein